MTENNIKEEWIKYYHSSLAGSYRRPNILVPYRLIIMMTHLYILKINSEVSISEFFALSMNSGMILSNYGIICNLYEIKDPQNNAYV